MDQTWPKRTFLIENEKSEHRHWIMHIWISLSIKLHLKLTILIFWTKFAQKGYFRSKTKKNEQHHWILHIRIRAGAIFPYFYFYGTSSQSICLFKCSKTIWKNIYIFKKKMCMIFTKILFFSVQIFFFQISVCIQNKYLYPLSKNLILLKKISLCKNIHSV